MMVHFHVMHTRKRVTFKMQACHVEDIKGYNFEHSLPIGDFDKNCYSIIHLMSQ